MFLFLYGLKDRKKSSIDPVFIAYILTIIQIAVEESDFGQKGKFVDILQQLHFLAFVRGPLMIMMLQTHFDSRHKKLCMGFMSILLSIGYALGEINNGDDFWESIEHVLTKMPYVLMCFLIFGIWNSRVNAELFHQIVSTELAQDKTHIILDNLEESIVILQKN